MLPPPPSRVVSLVTGCSLVACVYFQASAASALLGSSLSTESLLPPLSPHVGTHRSRHAAHQTPNTAALFTNNPFDWRVDLNPPATPRVETTAAPALSVDLTNPLLAEACTEVSVTIVTESTDPRWSVSVLQASGDPQPTERRVGDKVGDYEVAYIGFNRLKASPAVWLTNTTRLCQTLLFNAPSAPPPAVDTVRPPRSALAARRKSELPPELAERIIKLSDTHVAVERAVVDQVLADPSAFMSAARITSVKNGDSRSSVIRLTGLREGSLLEALNLHNGDVLTNINGFELNGPEQALNAYARLRSADNLTVEVQRGGKPLTLQVTIR
jgi:general secretion pathway protein C